MRFGHQNPHSQQPQQQKEQRQQQLLLYRYSCLKCGTVLKVTENPIDSSIFRAIKNERCVSCGNILQEQTVVVQQQQQQQQQQLPTFSQNDSSPYSSSSSPSSSSPPAPQILLPQTLLTPSSSSITTTTFETAYNIQQKRRTSTKLIFFDIAEIDSFLDLSDRGGSICVASSRSGDGDSWHANNTLVTRLCVRALMPRRHGGFGSPSVIFIDAGNCSDIYKCVSFIRQYGLDQQKTLDRIIVSRPFTIHQLARLIIYEVALVLQRTDARLVVISDLLRMFVQDPQIDPDEARWLVKEIARSLRKLSSQVLVVISLHECLPPQFRSLLLSLFDSQIHIATITNEPSRLQVNVVSYNSNNNLHHCHGGGSNSNSKGQSSTSFFMITEKDLQIIRAR